MDKDERQRLQARRDFVACEIKRNELRRESLAAAYEEYCLITAQNAYLREEHRLLDMKLAEQDGRMKRIPTGASAKAKDKVADFKSLFNALPEAQQAAILDMLKETK